jgi:hypothetical protein
VPSTRKRQWLSVSPTRSKVRVNHWPTETEAVVQKVVLKLTVRAR